MFLVALFLACAVVLATIDAFRPDIFPKVGKTALALAFTAAALFVIFVNLKQLVP